VLNIRACWTQLHPKGAVQARQNLTVSFCCALLLVAHLCSVESKPHAVQIRPGLPSGLGLTVGKGKMLMPDDFSGAPLAVVENGQDLDR
jgi:hypothetical protein